MQKNSILEIKGLSIAFSQYGKGLVKKDSTVITNLDLELYEGEILAVVGSSGSGKSLLAHAILGILPENARAGGIMRYDGREFNQKEKERIRGKEVVLIPQSVNYLDPLHTVGQQMSISLPGKNTKENSHIIRELLSQYGLPKGIADYYPHQLSGGMARKVLLLMALATEAKVIIADEPTPGLDEKSLNDVLKDFKSLAKSGKAVLMITHDINAALHIADRIAIFYGGSILEIANGTEFTGTGENLRHPYTRALFQALPTTEFTAIKGTQPLPSQLTKHCLFYDRCGIKTEACQKEMPEFREIRGGRARCIHAT